MPTVEEWPINGSELVRLLGLPHDPYHVLYVVRPLLAELGCAEQSSALRANWVVDRATAQRVYSILLERGFAVQPIPGA